jgi:hypothetical protein
MRGRSGIRNQELGIRYRGHLPDGLSYRAAPDSSRLILLMSEYATRTERLERYLSLAVGVAVIGAMLVSLYQANLARAQLRASAWPYLSQSNSWEGGTYHFVTVNEGIGPAKVKSFRVLVDGHSVPTWNAAMRALTGEGEPALTYGSFGHGTVLPAGATRALLSLPKGDRAVKFWSEGQKRMRTIACYCSVYDECWRSDSEEREPAPVRSCEGDAAEEFQQ